MLKSGTVLGPVGQSVISGNDDKKLKSGTVLGPASEKTLYALPGVPVSMQPLLQGDAAVQALTARGFSSSAEELEYQKNNPTLYAALGGNKYYEKQPGWAAFRNPVYSPETLNDEGKAAVEEAQKTDRMIKTAKGLSDTDLHILAKKESILQKIGGAQKYTDAEINVLKEEDLNRKYGDELRKNGFEDVAGLSNFVQKFPITYEMTGGRNYFALDSHGQKAYKQYVEIDQIRSMPDGKEKDAKINEYRQNMVDAKEAYKKTKSGILNFGRKVIGGAIELISDHGESTSEEEDFALMDYEAAARSYYLLIYGSDAEIKRHLEKAKGEEKEDLRAATKQTKTTSDYIHYFNASVNSGITNTVSGISATGELIFGTPIKGIIKLCGGDPEVISGKPYRDKVNGDAQTVMYEAAQKVGDKNAVFGNLTSNIVGNIPNVILAFTTGGVSTAGTLTNGGITTPLKSLAQNPMFWTSFSMTAGNDYEEALSDGASETTALRSRGLRT